MYPRETKSVMRIPKKTTYQMAKISSLTPRIIFLRTAWMNFYEGVTEHDIPKNGGAYVDTNKDGGEVYNFKKINGKYYGYAGIQKGGRISLKNLGLRGDSTEMEDVLVVFFATNPETGGKYIVGWYKNATLFSNPEMQSIRGRGNWKNYLAVCKAEDGCLIETDKRTFEVKGPGQNNIWYPKKKLSRPEFKALIRYLNNPAIGIRKKKKSNSRGGKWQQDSELRKKIELAAMATVREYFESRGFLISDVHKENNGWDLVAENGSKKLLLEVKGTQAAFAGVRITPNEYKQMKSQKGNYRLCVVSYALDEALRKTIIFYHNGKDWVDQHEQKLVFREEIFATVSLESTEYTI